MNAAIYFPEPRYSRPSRLLITVLCATALHLVLLLGVSFSLPKPDKVSRSLEVTLATFKAEKPPEKADFLAQNNQQGSGSQEKPSVPKTTEVAPLPSVHVAPPVALPPTPPPTTPIPAPKPAITTKAPTPVRAAPAETPVRTTPPRQVMADLPHFDREQLSVEISGLEAQLSHERELYAKRPRVHRLNAASTMYDKGAWYKEDWRRKIERVGNINYPDEARRQRLYGSLRLLVAINRDGTLREVSILESSGQPILDQAALRIVRLAAPFTPFSGDLADVDVLEIIRTWRFERGDRLASQ